MRHVLVFCVALLAGCGQQAGPPYDFVTPGIVAQSLGQIWFLLEVPEQEGQRSIGLVTTDSNGPYYHGAGVPIPAGRHPVMLQQQDNGRYSWSMHFPDGVIRSVATVRDNKNRSTDMTSSKRVIALGEVFYAIGSGTASIDKLVPDNVQFSFQVQEN